MLKKEKEHKIGNVAPINKIEEDQKLLSAKEKKLKPKLVLFDMSDDCGRQVHDI